MRVISGPSVINSAADFAQLKSSGLNIVVVSGINYCGSFIPNIVGCAPLSGNLLAVVRMSSFEDILWAHEFGHNCGLPHRADSNAIMHPQMATQHRVLLRAEAARYENKSFGSSGRLTPGANAGDEPFTVALDDGPPPATLEEYLGRIYLHGIPFAHVAGFGPEHVPRLQGILANPSQEKIWGNAAVALAAIATPGAIDAVNKFIFAGSGRLSPDAYQAKRAAMMALGYASQQAVRRASPERRQAVLAQLRAGLAPDYWRQRAQLARSRRRSHGRDRAAAFGHRFCRSRALWRVRGGALVCGSGAVHSRRGRPGADRAEGAGRIAQGPRAGTARLHRPASLAPGVIRAGDYFTAVLQTSVNRTSCAGFFS